MSAGCDGAAWRAPGYFCAEQGAEGCALGRVSLAYCDLVRHSAPLPLQYQYFADDQARRDGPTPPDSPLAAEHPPLTPSGLMLGQRMGGSNALEDYCPTWMPYSNWDCRVAGSGSGDAAAAAAAARDKGEQRCALVPLP